MLEYRENGGILVNKSHAAAYSVLTCKTAYYKYKYPEVFYAATLNYTSNPKKQKNILTEAFGEIKVIPPRMSQFSYRYQAVGDTMMFGISGIKGFGDALQDLQIRPANNIYEFCVLNPDIPKDNLESLVKVGFFDEWGYTRNSLLSVLEMCTKEAGKQTENSENIDFFKEMVYPILSTKENSLSLLSNEEYFESLQWETELMGVGMSINHGMSVLKSKPNTAAYNDDSGWYNFIVLSCSDGKTTSKGSPYYEALLMDIKGNMIKRRFDQPIASACIRAFVYEEDKKYCITKCAQHKPEPLTKTQFNLDVATLSEEFKQKALKSEPTPTHTQEVIADDNYRAYYVRPNIFYAMKEKNMIYQGDFKQVMATANTI